MRTLIIGAGAVGGYYGARLTAAGRDVTFLVRSARAQQLRHDGLQVLSPFGDLTLQPNLLLASDLASRPQIFDLIVVSTKSYSLAAAVEDFAPAVGPQTAILPLLNGMAHLDFLDARFGQEHVLGGSTRIVSDLDSEGRVVQFEKWQDLHFGERFSAQSYAGEAKAPRRQAIQAELNGTGFEAVLSPDIIAFMWQKWVFLASVAALTCMLRGSVGQIVSAAGGPETARAMLGEADAIATANGYPTSPEFLDLIRNRILVPGSSLTASMYRDMMRGNAVEADHIVGDLLARGRPHGLVTPLLQAAFVQLGMYSSLRSAELAGSAASPVEIPS